MEVDCFVDGLFASRAAVPSGASTGSYEAVELRDGGDFWHGSGAEKALKKVKTYLREIFFARDVSNKKPIDN